jgi:hypothetical protein
MCGSRARCTSVMSETNGQNMPTNSNFENVSSIVGRVYLISTDGSCTTDDSKRLGRSLTAFASLSHMRREFVQQPRKWDAPGLARFMVVIGRISSVFDISTFCLLWNGFLEGLLSQTLIVHTIRTRKIPFIQSMAAEPLLNWKRNEDSRKTTQMACSF